MNFNVVDDFMSPAPSTEAKLLTLKIKNASKEDLEHWWKTEPYGSPMFLGWVGDYYRMVMIEVYGYTEDELDSLPNPEVAYEY